VGPIFNLIFIVFFLDRVGRRKPLIFGTIAISIALVCEAALGSQVTNATGSRKDGISGAGVFFLFLVSCIFSVSFGPISWVYASEIMPLSIRGRGSAFSTAVGNWLVGTIWSQVSPIALGAITYKFYFIFVAFNLFVTLPTILFVFKVGGIGSFDRFVSANVDVGDESALARGDRLAVRRSCAWNASG
jgi:MFS family permease